jgi:RHS repeat-associated protein
VETLDALGNWTGVTTDGVTQMRTANAQNQYTAVGNIGPSYDANGNLTVDENGKKLSWDAWNRPVQVLTSGGSANYTYDALGRRITENEAGRATDVYFSSGWQVLEEDTSSGMQAQYVWSPVYVDALVERDRGSERLYAEQDANWNTTALVDKTSNANVVERYTYDPYGKVNVLDNNWNAQDPTLYADRYLFQGGRYDTTSGLYNYRNRDQSPTLGRWTRPDPLGFDAGDSNLYRYVNNGPPGATDPSGHDIFWLSRPSNFRGLAQKDGLLGLTSDIARAVVNTASGFDFGHSGVLIGPMDRDKETGFVYFSYSPPAILEKKTFGTFDGALRAVTKESKYKSISRWKTTVEQDKTIVKTIEEKFAKTFYFLFHHNCNHVVGTALKGGGYDQNTMPINLIAAAEGNQMKFIEYPDEYFQRVADKYTPGKGKAKIQFIYAIDDLLKTHWRRGPMQVSYRDLFELGSMKP